MERQDRERWEEEAARADAVQLQIQEERRKRIGLDDTADGELQKRGARQKDDAEREAKERKRKQRQAELEAEMDPEVAAERQRAKDKKKRETEERQRVRAEKEANMAKQHAKLDKEHSKKSASRLEYLLKQSSIFGKLKMGKDDQAEIDKQNAKKNSDGSSGSNGEKAKAHHRPMVEGEESDEEDMEAENHVFLTQQPSCIKFGNLKPYQLESLNWMIHLAEKGLNGILADGMSIALCFFFVGFVVCPSITAVGTTSPTDSILQLINIFVLFMIRFF